MSQGLTTWFAIWHRRYAGFMVRLILAAIIAATLVYGQNAMLAWLMEGLAGAGLSTPGPIRDFAAALAVAPIILTLALFVLVRLAAAGTSVWSDRITGRMQNMATVDLEREILGHLLGKDDSFFARHSPAETVNRLAVDVVRVCTRRSAWITVWNCALLIAGSVLFFLGQDWRLALLAMSGCAAGAWWAWRTTRQVKAMDADYLRTDDLVKSRFEDYLRAAPEVQVGGLAGSVQRRFGEVQQGRSKAFLKYIAVNSRLSGGGTVAFVLTFLGMTAVILYRRWSGQINEAAALVPVILYALPGLFTNASQLVMVNLRFGLARTSMNRLVEYETQPPAGVQAQPPAEKPPVAQELRATGVTYRYLSPDGVPQGGVMDVTAEFRPGEWTAIVGGAGSGKSTLLRLLLGRGQPQQGQVCCGARPLDSISPGELAAIMSLMPQSLALLNASIAQNVAFGRPDGGASPALAAEDIDIIERIGLGAICRAKALDMAPDGDAASLGAPIAEIRRQVRQHLADTCGVHVVPYEAGGNDPLHWFAELLLGGRCNRLQAAPLILRSGAGMIRASDGLGPGFTAAGRALLRSTAKLLSAGNYQTYCRLAPVPVEEAVWSFRARHAHLAGTTVANEPDLGALAAIALTACQAELVDAEPAGEWPWSDPAWRAKSESALGSLKAALGAALVPFDGERLHPFLTWRENLVFGAVEVRNSRLAREVDATVGTFIAGAGYKDLFTRIGLAYEIGRSGVNLSGGQGQLVGMARALLRHTPVLVLDEPTSALDPASRTRVVEFLRVWRSGGGGGGGGAAGQPGRAGSRVVITVSHDPELVRHADQILVLESGRLAACGSFEQLRQSSQAFAAVMRQT